MNKPVFSASELYEIRSEFPHIKNGLTYLNHAAIGVLSRPVKAAIDQFIDERHNGPIDNFENGMEISASARKQVSDYLNAPSPDQITFLGNTSDGLTAAAEGFDWQPGDQILVNTMEFPATIQPFRALRHLGVEVVYAEPEDGEITADILEKYITLKTKMVTLSSVQYLSGFRSDLKSIGELCHKKGIFFVVDAIQSLGAFQIDVQKCHIDALASGSHKWLMSPMGISFLYLSKPFAKKLRPFKTGWLSVKEPWELSNFEQGWQPISQHLEIGTPNMLGITGLNASLSFLADSGIEKIASRIINLTNYIIKRLEQQTGTIVQSPKKSYKRGGIVSFTVNGMDTPESKLEELKSKNVTISLREGHFRISPHFYNIEDEIDHAIDIIFNHQ